MAKEKGKKAKKRSRSQIILFAVITAIVCASLSYGLSLSKPLERMELLSLDFRFQNRPHITVNPQVGYVNLDNASCDLAGSWPWTRNFHVTLIRALDFYGCKSAGYDVFFTEVSPLVSAEISTSKLKTPESRKKIIESLYRNDDKDFMQALLETDCIYLGEFLKSPVQNGIPDDPASIASYIEKDKLTWNDAKTDSITASNNNTFGYKGKHPMWNEVEKTVETVAPIAALSDASQGVGFEQIIPDNITGTVYEYPMFLEYDGKIHPALGLLMVADILGIDLDTTKIIDGKFFEFTTTKAYKEFQPGTFRVPMNQKLRMLMNWSGPYFETFFHINFKMLSFYWAYIEAKKEVKVIKPNFVTAKNAIAEITEMIINNRFTQKEEAPAIAQEIVVAYLVEKNKTMSLNEFKTKLKKTGLEENLIARVYDSVHLSHSVLKHVDKEKDYEFIRREQTKHDYLEFRDGLWDESKYENIDSNHQKEIARNVLVFAEKNNLEAVSPLYFPPCLQNHVAGDMKDISPTMIQDKIFMIGLEGEGTIDLNPQPYEKSCAMVALHANAINTFLTRQFLHYKNNQLMVILCFVLAIFVAFYSQLIKTQYSLLITVLVIGGFTFYVQNEFSQNGVWIGFVPPVFSVVLTYITSVGIQLYIAFKEKQKMKGMFGKMVSPDVLKVMSDNPDLFSLTGRRQPCTSYFSSMENFGEINKGVTPQELTSLLSDYLTPASQIITSYAGYIDKYEGHIIMADYGVPIPTDNHTEQCLYSSIEQQIDIKAFQTYVFARFGKEVNTSMGVNTGFVSAGNMGSDRKMQYTIMGDTVNTAARFRPANWIYNYLGSVIIGEMTYPVVKDIVQVRNLDKLLLKGKLKPVDIYEVMGWDPEHYMQTRAKIDVTENLKVCWAKHCPAEKIYGYRELFAYQFERTEHPLCKEIASFFDSHIATCAELTEYSVKSQISNMMSNYRNYAEFYKNVTSKELTAIPNGEWKDKLHQWAHYMEEVLKDLEENYKGNVEAEQSHRDLLEVFEKIEALEARLEFHEKLCPELDEVWEKIREYISSNFDTDQEDYHEKYMALYAQYEEKALEFVDTITPRMEEYHTMMSKIGSRTEKETRGSELYEEALALHWERKWDESIECFKKVLEYLPNDKAVLSFIDRLEGYKQNPPKDDWQGEFKQTKK